MESLVYEGHVDIVNCEDEPIHLLGKLQSHGLLFGFNSGLELSHISENAIPLLEDESFPSGTWTLEKILGKDAVVSAKSFMSSKELTRSRYERLYPVGNRSYRIHWSKSSEEVLLAELERANDSITDTSTDASLGDLQEFMQNIRHIREEQDLAVQMVLYFRKLTGFDRVMYYKFDHNGDGEVIAEDKRKGLESFLGLRYPASDIPAQARKLYELNTIRSIHDVTDAGVPIYGLKDSSPLDLSYAVYRSVSPIHLEYLSNMGVHATHANSILVEGKLWGMVICHHYESAYTISLKQRQLTTLYTDAVNSWLVNFELTKRADKRARTAQLMSKLSHGELDAPLKDELTACFGEIKDLIGICGFSVMNNGEIFHHGEHLESDSDLINLKKEFKNLESEQSFLTYDDVRGFSPESQSAIGGVALVNIGLRDDLYVFFYRPEKRLIYNWAGDPKKTYKKTGTNKLNPRNSFKLWQETVKGKSLPWKPDDFEFLSNLIDVIEIKEALVIQDLHQRSTNAGVQRTFTLKRVIQNLEAEVNRLKTEASEADHIVAEAMRVNELKEIVMSNMSHEMRTPLNGIIGLANLLEADDIDNQERVKFAGLIRISSLRMLDTFTKLMKLDLTEINAEQKSSERVNISDFLFNLLDRVKNILDHGKQRIDWQVHNRKDEIVPHETIVGQIVINLVNNALRYGGAEVSVLVDARVLWVSGKELLQITVEDDGPGIEVEEQNKIFEAFYMGKQLTNRSDEGSGLGLFIVNSYIKFLNGTIELESARGEGAKFTISIPLRHQS